MKNQKTHKIPDEYRNIINGILRMDQGYLTGHPNEIVYLRFYLFGEFYPFHYDTRTVGVHRLFNARLPISEDASTGVPDLYYIGTKDDVEIVSEITGIDSQVLCDDIDNRAGFVKGFRECFEFVESGVEEEATFEALFSELRRGGLEFESCYKLGEYDVDLVVPRLMLGIDYVDDLRSLSSVQREERSRYLETLGWTMFEIPGKPDPIQVEVEVA